VRRNSGICVLGIAIAGALMLVSAPARADVRSEVLYARGLVPFNSGQWEQAYRLFNEAVEADPSDAVAVYYRGVTQARRGMLGPAIQDLEHALKLKPTLPHGALDLGIAYFDAGQYAAARPWLQRAREQPADRFTAAYFLGLTLYRLGDYAGALTALKDAEPDPELRSSAHYYEGLALLKQGKAKAARAELAAVAHEQPESPIGRAAQAYSGGEVRQPPGLLAAARKKPWSAYAGLAFQYDSNVALAPSDSGLKTAQGIGQQDDGRAVIEAGGDYVLLDNDFGSVRAEYDFYQSMHFRLTEFDLQGHRVRLDAGAHPTPLGYGLAVTYDFYALDYQSFFQEGLVTPWVAYAENPGAATQAYYTFRGRDFFRAPFNPARDSKDNAFGLRQYLTLGAVDRVLSFGYQFDSDSTAADDFDYNGNQVDIEAMFPVTNLATAQLGYLFRLEDYRHPNSRSAVDQAAYLLGQAVRRHDSEHQFTVAVSRNLTEHVALTLAYIGVINDSNIVEVFSDGSKHRPFEYDRHIVSAEVQVTF
jgi:Flp pilus assembly protein TadD